MIKYCLDKWEKNKDALERDLREDTTLNECEYLYLVKKVVSIILNGGDEAEWDTGNIIEIDGGQDCQGTLLFIIPRDTYLPSEYEYLMTYVNYGGCNDVLLDIQFGIEKEITEGQVKDFMALCKDLVCSMIKPYNGGVWREEEEFQAMEYKAYDE